jgi:LuxR family maltose regulon positive regulatory protein
VRRLLSWTQQLPPVCQENNPHLAVLSAWALLLSGEREPDGVAALLDAIESREETAGELRGDIAALRARIAAFHDDIPQVIAFAQQALQELPLERVLLRADVAFGLGGTYTALKDLDAAYRMLSEALHISQALVSLRTAMFASRYLASVCIEQGRLSEAEAILRQALHFAGAGEGARVPACGIVHIGLAELLYERNELGAALHHARLGLALGESGGEIKVLLGGYCILALIFAARGERGRAWQEVWKAERIATIGKVTWLSKQVAAIAIRLSLMQNDRGGAERALRTIGLDAHAGIEQAPPTEQEDVRLMQARIWLAEEKYDAVVDLLTPVVSAAQQGKRIRAVIAARGLQAVALGELRERQRAAYVLSEALSLAGPQGYTRTLLDMGEPMQAVLQRIAVKRDAKAYARRLIEARRDDDEALRRLGALSQREYEVLQLMAAGMSNQEIAEALIIETSTVKVHVRHVCQKLGVQNRLQAAVKAREKGLLRPSK